MLSKNIIVIKQLLKCITFTQLVQIKLLPINKSGVPNVSLTHNINKPGVFQMYLAAHNIHIHMQHAQVSIKFTGLSNILFILLVQSFNTEYQDFQKLCHTTIE